MKTSKESLRLQKLKALNASYLLIIKEEFKLAIPDAGRVLEVIKRVKKKRTKK